MASPHDCPRCGEEVTRCYECREYWCDTCDGTEHTRSHRDEAAASYERDLRALEERNRGGWGW